MFLVWVADIFCSSGLGSLCSAFSAFCKGETLICFVCVAEIIIFPIWSLQNPVSGRLVVTVVTTSCDAKLSILLQLHLVVPCNK